MSEIELHRKLLGDARRNAAFHDALRQVITPGRTRVLDIGAGTGFLSFLARRLGAKNCTLIEYTDALDLAETLARRNGIDGLSFIKGHSMELKRRIAADVIVTETLGNFALEEGFLETAVDARRFLAPGGCLLPARLRQFVAPVCAPRLQSELDIWPRIGFELDFEAARSVSLNNMYVKSIAPADLPAAGGAAARAWDDLDLRPDRPAPPSRREASVHWDAAALAAPAVYGFALWWEAELLPGIGLSTSPFEPPTHWEQIYLPLLQPLTGLGGEERIELQLDCDTRPEVGVRLRWRTALQRAGAAPQVQQQDSLRGRL